MDGNNGTRGLIWAVYKRNGGLAIWWISQPNTIDLVFRPIKKNMVIDNNIMAENLGDW